MPNNLHISYDLKKPDKNYDRVITTIKTLGSWAKIHFSYWYVDSKLSAAQARDTLLTAVDADDSFYIVDATNGNATWHNVDPKVAAFIREHWLTKAA